MVSFYSKEREALKNRITLLKIFGNFSLTFERYTIRQIKLQYNDVQLIFILFK